MVDVYEGEIYCKMSIHDAQDKKQDISRMCTGTSSVSVYPSISRYLVYDREE